VPGAGRERASVVRPVVSGLGRQSSRVAAVDRSEERERGERKGDESIMNEASCAT
jgi:hypothetical protein